MKGDTASGTGKAKSKLPSGVKRPTKVGFCRLCNSVLKLLDNLEAICVSHLFLR